MGGLSKERRKGEEKRQQEQEDQRQQAKQGQNARQDQSKQGEQVRFGDEEQFEETRAESTDEHKATDGLAEVQTGRGNAGLVRGEMRDVGRDETRRDKGKGNGGKGEHEGKGGAGSKGRQQVENTVMDEDQGNTGVMRSEEEEENHKEDVRK